MEAVRLYKKNLIKVENIPFEDSLKDDQVLVEIAYAGICGSDLHNYKTVSGFRGHLLRLAMNFQEKF